MESESADIKQEFILLSDILGLSLLVDAINHPKPPSCTEGSVLGPFHTHDAPTIPNGSSMSTDPEGEPLLVVCSVRDTQGNPIPDVKIDIWETDSTGHYDVQHADREGPSERCVMTSDAKGEFWFNAIKPIPYPIPNDGPVGKLLGLLKRHCWRPSHMHFMFEKEGWDHLITYVNPPRGPLALLTLFQCAVPARRPIRNLRRRVWCQEKPSRRLGQGGWADREAVWGQGRQLVPPAGLCACEHKGNG